MRRSPLALHILAFLVLAAAAAGFWVHRIHVERPGAHQDLANTDAFIQFYPEAFFVGAEIARGELPLWNPYQLAGQPFVALHIPGALYPPSLMLLALLPPERAMELHAILHLALAGLFTWLLCARLGLDPLPRLAAALFWMFAGPLLWSIYMPPYLSTQVWLPALLWALHGLLCEARARWAVALALFASLSFLGGCAQVFVFVVQVSIGLGLCGLFVLAPRGTRLRCAALALGAAALTLALAAPQLFPAFELLADATRDFGGLPLSAATPSIPPPLLLHGLHGFALSDPFDYAPLLPGAAPFDPASAGPGWWSVWIPIGGVPLALLGVAARRQRGYWIVCLLAAAVAGMFTLGAAAPVFRLYHALPLGDLFRAPAHMSFVYMFLVALLLGLGIQGAAELLRRLPIGRWTPGALEAVLLLAMILPLYARHALVLSHPASSPIGAGAPAELIRFLESRPGYPRVFIETPPFSPFTLLHKLGMMNGVLAVPDYEPNLPASYQRYFRRPALPPWHGELTIVEDRGVAPVPLELLDAMSVRYYATPARPADGLRQRFGVPVWNAADALRRRFGEPVWSAAGVEVFERRKALPHAYVVQRARVEADPERAVARLLEPGFDPRREAVVDRELPPLAETGRGVAEITSYEPLEVRVRAECSAPCLLVLTDLAYPGWRASVDGAPAEAAVVNGLFRGVRLEAGRHEVVYRYRPASFWLGAALALTALAALTAAGARAGLRRRQVRPAPRSGSG